MHKKPVDYRVRTCNTSLSYNLVTITIVCTFTSCPSWNKVDRAVDVITAAHLSCHQRSGGEDSQSRLPTSTPLAHKCPPNHHHRNRHPCRFRRRHHPPRHPVVASQHQLSQHARRCALRPPRGPHSSRPLPCRQWYIARRRPRRPSRP